MDTELFQPEDYLTPKWYFFKDSQLGRICNSIPWEQLADCLPEENHSCAVSLVWSAKESVLKAIKTGLRVDTRRIEIENFDIPQGTRWAPVQARDVEKNEIFTGWWRRLEGMVYSVFSDPQTGCPIALHTPATPLGGFR